MRPEVRPHRYFQNRRVAVGVQPAAVDDADASVAVVPAVLEEPLDAGARLGSRHAVQVAPVADDVSTLLELPDLAAVDAVRDEIVLSCVNVVASWRCVTWETDSWSIAHASARVRLKADDVPHLPGKCIGVSDGCVMPKRALGRSEPCAAFLHTAIL